MTQYSHLDPDPPEHGLDVQEHAAEIRYSPIHSCFPSLPPSTAYITNDVQMEQIMVRAKQKLSGMWENLWLHETTWKHLNWAVIVTEGMLQVISKPIILKACITHKC